MILKYINHNFKYLKMIRKITNDNFEFSNL